MTRPRSRLYHFELKDVEKRIASAIARGRARAVSETLFFFRADDIGYPSTDFSTLIDCFLTHSLPLCLAVVPAWLNKNHLHQLRSFMGYSSQWYCHQHGRLHHNFQKSGKKMEFGPDRSQATIHRQLELGKSHLRKLLGEDFHPVFTPPWNRCSETTLQTLVELDYCGVSRSSGAKPTAPASLPEFEVNVDLHTRKEPDGEDSFAALLTELEESLAAGRAGIMIHHQRMNRRAFNLLDTLLASIKRSRIPVVHFGDLLTA